MTVIAHVDAQFQLPRGAYEMWFDDELAQHLGIGEQYRVEVIEGEIVVSPGPVAAHNKIVTSLTLQIEMAHHQSALGLRALATQDFAVPSIAAGYIPDLIVLDDEQFDAIGDETRVLFPRDITACVEVTSESNTANDTVRKLRGYAAGGVPFYLLVHRQERAVILHSTPEGTLYRRTERWNFGESFDFLGLTVSTSDWS